MRLIDAEQLKKAVRENYGGVLDAVLVRRFIDEYAEPVDAEPVKHGHWHFVRTNVYSNIYECSVCGRSILASNLSDFPYCHCGAKMDEEVRDAQTD